ncbi:hypothetical protein MH117_03770 [Paenibacillus sp. ACRRX]|uniref:hypothetical protein n=1 Tax=unclassified Paenibacillus TaxID=185978 RepID=UPI001EF6889C|nr:MULTISPECIES: hypothetical protein [unclassified Paenibacillus]MCG7406523.1 hypothetical protein [Paenibacillus sp. ACRRX]MDK8179555.1 hypothetical protein [Paenibacillus sp. UMB4589-SE434]
MKLYEELKTRKEAGEKLNLEELTPELLKNLFIEEELSDYLISQLFEVKESKITYRRRKFGITIRNSILDELLLAKTDEAKEVNEKYKDTLMVSDNLTVISKAITHFAFRNGPIEEMHAGPKNQLSQEDMKTLNKFMVNKIAYVFELIIENRWIELDFLIRHTDMMYGQDWDNAEPDAGDNRELIQMMIKRQ